MKDFIRVIAFLLRKVTTVLKKKSSPHESFSLLPDEIIEKCLARVPRSYYPKLSLVSKSFRSILSSTDIYAARSRLGTTQQCLYVCLRRLDSSYKEYSQWIALSVNPSRTEKKKKKKNRTGQLAVPSSNLGSEPIIAGYEIYVFGGYRKPSSTVQVLDCRSHTWHNAPSINVARECPRSYVYDGKIYVIGSYKRLLEHESWGEVFDIKTQTWECLPEPCFNEGTKYDYYYYDPKPYDYYYDPKQCKWKKRSERSRRPECVMMDNVLYSFEEHCGRYSIWWRDINGGYSMKEVKGLDSFGSMYEMHSGLLRTGPKPTSCGGKLYGMWEEYTMENKIINIWCAEISIEKRDGDEIRGNVEWVDVVHTASKQCHFSHFLAISI